MTYTTFTHFHSELQTLANNNSIQINILEDLIKNFLITRSLPHLESYNSFVVRCSLNKVSEVFSNINRCSYPPDSIKNDIDIQRANYPEQQVFYCTMPTDTSFANASSTAFVESCWEHIEDTSIRRGYATLSRWDTIRPLRLWVLPFSENNCKKNKDMFNIRNNIKDLITQNKNSTDDILTLEFFSNSFCANTNKKINYKITSAFYNALLKYELEYKLERDGLMYPSANTEAGGINLVLKKELIDNKVLNCSNILMSSIQKMPNNIKNIKFMPASNYAVPDTKGNFGFQYIL